MQLDIEPWETLYNVYNLDRYSAAETHRKFTAFTGVVPCVAEIIFQRYYDVDHLPNRSRLLLVLFYLKTAPTENVGAAKFGLTRTTYRIRLWDTLEYLDNTMDEIHLNGRFEPYYATEGVFRNVTLIVDATECAIDRPSKHVDRNLYSSGRNKENTYGRYTLKYTVACQVVSGLFCFVDGPEPGSVPDITALRNSELELMLEPDEIILGDKGYQGHWKCLTPIKGKHIGPIDEAFNETLAQVRILAECGYSRLKIFDILKVRFGCELWKHPVVFRVCCHITNINMEWSPLWSFPNPYLAQFQNQYDVDSLEVF